MNLVFNPVNTDELCVPVSWKAWSYQWHKDSFSRIFLLAKYSTEIGTTTGFFLDFPFTTLTVFLHIHSDNCQVLTQEDSLFLRWLSVGINAKRVNI